METEKTTTEAQEAQETPETQTPETQEARDDNEGKDGVEETPIKEEAKQDVIQEATDAKKLPQTNYVRLRGLPYSAKESDIRDFFEGLVVSHNGRPSGECYCELSSKQDTLKALDLHRKEMDGRYIEVFTVSVDELTNLKRAGLVTDDGKVIRLRGLPFSATVQDVKDFFKGLNCEEVVFGRTGGRPSGEAFVRLATRDEAGKALDFNKQHMGSRWESGLSFNAMPRFFVYLFCSFILGMRSAPYDIPRGGGYGRYDEYDDFNHLGFQIFMRGLPFDADAFMIEQFFAPLRCIEISLGFNEDRRPSGDAVVEFGTTAEAHEAFSRNKAMMGKRYVELFGANEMPSTMRRLTWRVVGGQPAPRPLPLVTPPRGKRPYAAAGYGGGARNYEPAPAPGPFRGYATGAYGGGGGAPARGAPRGDRRWGWLTLAGIWLSSLYV
ncbi:unnamed protein product [Heligmosomoides polygyrus]|uniref:RRM domain-containing protein n=1 Tax=Heligmosomoides polygyrus TaxID=6339 RepID=A0A183FI63_HELPZ|nr:unnamed protein product [Heligmosomoides polygyrus]